MIYMIYNIATGIWSGPRGTKRTYEHSIIEESITCQTMDRSKFKALDRKNRHSQQIFLQNWQMLEKHIRKNWFVYMGSIKKKTNHVCVADHLCSNAPTAFPQS